MRKYISLGVVAIFLLACTHTATYMAGRWDENETNLAVQKATQAANNKAESDIYTRGYNDGKAIGYKQGRGDIEESIHILQILLQDLQNRVGKLEGEK